MLQPTIQNINKEFEENLDIPLDYDDKIKLTILLNSSIKQLLVALLDELEILETPENDVACDYAEHINKEQITQIINKKIEELN